MKIITNIPFKGRYGMESTANEKVDSKAKGFLLKQSPPSIKLCLLGRRLNTESEETILHIQKEYDAQVIHTACLKLKAVPSNQHNFDAEKRKTKFLL